MAGCGVGTGLWNSASASAAAALFKSAAMAAANKDCPVPGVMPKMLVKGTPESTTKSLMFN